MSAHLLIGSVHSGRCYEHHVRSNLQSTDVWRTSKLLLVFSFALRHFIALSDLYAHAIVELCAFLFKTVHR